MISSHSLNRLCFWLENNIHLYTNFCLHVSNYPRLVFVLLRFVPVLRTRAFFSCLINIFDLVCVGLCPSPWRYILDLVCVGLCPAPWPCIFLFGVPTVRRSFQYSGMSGDKFPRMRSWHSSHSNIIPFSITYIFYSDILRSGYDVVRTHRLSMWPILFVWHVLKSVSFLVIWGI